ncbi:uncharacterized protein V2V93DRAFT_358277 [Kockiozyma suomiensis]|uniref:uncharacterized protein n=1 Tax=Kockiozyma suomiensis TaxID=1337062 RepID=UPI0033441082
MAALSNFVPTQPTYIPPSNSLIHTEPLISIDGVNSSLPTPRSSSILELFDLARKARRPLFIAAPMVRYSKLPFRMLLQHFGLDLIYTPMMLAREFKNSPHARTADFSTTTSDSRVLLAQFGASNADDLCAATRIIRPYIAGVGINCGCPIKDQVAEGIGAALMSKPEVVEQMVRTLRAEFGDDLVIDVKIRVHSDLDKTLAFARRVADAGANIVTVHGRRRKDRSGGVPVNLLAIKLVREALPPNVYVVANGDCFSFADALRIANETGVDGVMAARGLLENPAMFLPTHLGSRTPWKAVELFWAYAEEYGLTGKFQHLQLVVADMTAGILTKQERQEIRLARNWQQLTKFMDSRFILKRRGEQGFAQLDYDGFRKL